MRGRTTRPVNSTKFNSSVLIVWSRCQILTNWRDVIYSLFVCLLSDDVYRFAREFFMVQLVVREEFSTYVP